MSNHPRVFEHRDRDMIERVEVADVATAGWLVTRIVMTRHGVAIHAINIGNFDYLTNTWVRIETLLSSDFVEMDNNGSDSDNRRRDRPPTAVAASPATYVKPVAFTAAAIEQPTPAPQPPAVLDTPLRSDNKRKVEAELTLRRHRGEHRSSEQRPHDEKRQSLRWAQRLFTPMIQPP
jgi:hypothetical protein